MAATELNQRDGLGPQTSPSPETSSLMGERPDSGVRIIGQLFTFKTAYRIDCLVLDNARLDIEFQEQSPFLRKLMKRLERRPRTANKNPEPLDFRNDVQEPSPLQLNIVIQIVGSQGDIQPFIALGKELQGSGHRVRLATHLKFRKEIKQNRLEFFDIGGDPEQLMAFMVQNPGLIPDLRTIKSGAVQQRRQEIKAILSGCWRSCFEEGEGSDLPQIPENIGSNETSDCVRPFVADVIIANPPSFAHFSCAEKLGIPLHMMFTMPWSPTRAFPHPLANVRAKSNKVSVANFASYALFEVLMWEGLGDLVNKFRKKELGLDPLDPDDWSDNIDICGFQFLTSERNYEPPLELQEFLDAGERPIYIGFGSVVVADPVRLNTIIFEAIQETGQRAVVSQGWSNLGASTAETPCNVFLLDKCPHEWLFPRVSCVIHHGGAGTTAAGLLEGCPTVIVPFFGDQLFWGSIVAHTGAGPRAIPYKQLTTANLVAAIETALQSSTKNHAEAISSAMRKEDGVQNAVRSFHHHTNFEKLRCSLCPHKPAAWWVRRSHIRLSALAASVLVQSGHIDPHQLAMYRPREYETNHEYRGPLSASAEVSYRFLTNMVGGMARILGELPSTFSGTRRMEAQGRAQVRDSAVAYFAETVPREKKKEPLDTSENSGSIQIPDISLSPHEPAEGSLGGQTNRAHGSVGGIDTASASQGLMNHSRPRHDSPSQRETRTQANVAKFTPTQRALSDPSSYKAGKVAIKLLDFVLILPADFALGLTKGFHNGPKLYHDSMVREIPTVRSIKSGLRVAGTVIVQIQIYPESPEFTQEIYAGVTGVFVQPVHAIRQSGFKGLVPGIGKGLFGIYFKSLSGLCGLAGFPLDGLHKSLRHSLSKDKLRKIEESRIEQGIEEMCAAPEEEKQKIIRGWQGITTPIG
ncbi:hypothetical protein N7510_006067 [Penicillium lagena]|uniref:uncharacterized protein n=1 Tax=Penicillium lagena TaxID=94218 RepID=UPI002541027F|nr:uncharacterized protein N7510_006067 [Penicillium lagena]KAJ5612873.1 hypothetical protein N7510_006067 [Penicillium lagena]